MRTIPTKLLNPKEPKLYSKKLDLEVFLYRKAGFSAFTSLIYTKKPAEWQLNYIPIMGMIP